MSRPLVVLALAVFAAAGLAPLGVMLLEVGTGDLERFADATTLELLGRTVAMGLGSAAVAFLLGLPFGFLVARTDVWGAGVWRALGVVPLVLPPLFLAMTWTAVAGVRGVGGAVWCFGLGTFPLVALFSARAFERVDARTEEAALLLGGLATVLRVELPLVLPAALAGTCLAFTFAINDFAVPDYLGSVGPQVNVYAASVMLAWNDFTSPGLAVLTSLPLVALALAAWLPAARLRRRGSLATLSGDFRTPERLRLGRGRVPATLFVAALVGLAALVPLGRLLYEAAEGPALARAGGSAGAFLAGARDALRSSFALAVERSRTDLANSLVWSAGAALASLPVGLVLGHAIERCRRRRLGLSLEGLALVPLAAPALLFGIGVIALWNRAAVAPFYDGGGMVVVMWLGRFGAFAVLVLAGAVASLDRGLEEAGAVAGAGPARRLGRLVTPNLRSALVGGFVLVFVLAMRDVDSAILLPAANRTAVFRIYNGVHFGRDAYVAALSLLLAFSIVLPGLLWTLLARRRLEVLP